MKHMEGEKFIEGESTLLTNSEKGRTGKRKINYADQLKGYPESATCRIHTILI